jgi:hypothetical protein
VVYGQATVAQSCGLLPAAAARHADQEGGKPIMNDLVKLAVLAAAVYGAYKAVMTAWRLGSNLFG